jgi:hypothetical protein
MATTVKESYDVAPGSYHSITITLNSLGISAARQSTAIDNTTNLFLDILVFATIKPGTVVAPSSVSFYVGEIGDGNAYPDALGASDAAYSMLSPTNLKLLGQHFLPTNATAYASEGFSVRNALGHMPQKFVVVAVNNTGAALDASAGGTMSWYGETITNN